MIQDDDNIVIRDTAKDAQFEADLNRGLDLALQYNRGRELAWTFPITLVTHNGQKCIHTLYYYIPRGILVENIPQQFKQFVYDKVNEFKEMTIQNRAIINKSIGSDLTSKRFLFTDILIGAHK